MKRHAILRTISVFCCICVAVAATPGTTLAQTWSTSGPSIIQSNKPLYVYCESCPPSAPLTAPVAPPSVRMLPSQYYPSPTPPSQDPSPYYPLYPSPTPAPSYPAPTPPARYIQTITSAHNSATVTINPGDEIRLQLDPVPMWSIRAYDAGILRKIEGGDGRETHGTFRALRSGATDLVLHGFQQCFAPPCPRQIFQIRVIVR